MLLLPHHPKCTSFPPSLCTPSFPSLSFQLRYHAHRPLASCLQCLPLRPGPLHPLPCPMFHSPSPSDFPGHDGRSGRTGPWCSLLSRQLLEQSREHCRQDTLRPALRRCRNPGAPFACPRFPPILHCRVTGSEERGAQTLGENTPSVQGTPGL